MSSLLTAASPSESVAENTTTRTPAASGLIDAVAHSLLQRRLPEATYRLQVWHEFTFKQAREIVGYLSELGISHCYLSPYLKATTGSTHGYDIVDHNAINPEIGSEEDFAAFANELKTHSMGQILDVVPNHMGVASSENPWWLDVLENGPGSPYASFFDIDWMPLKPDLANKVLLPILGDQFGKVLENQELVLTFEEGAFVLRYFERRFPIASRSWEMILKHRIEELEARLGAEDPQMLEYRSIVTAVGHLPPTTETDPEKVNERRREKEVLKRRLQDLAIASPEVDRFLQETICLFNGSRGDPRSFDLLDQLLLDQPYRLADWRVAADEINYRRFFDVNELAAICMERPDVFQKTHALILRLLAEGKVAGLRIDHPDGLYDPPEYIRRLQRARFEQLCREAYESSLSERSGTRGTGDLCADAAALPAWEDLRPELVARFDELERAERDEPLARPLYVVVEKILEPAERLPANWPVYGTTGYEFLNALNGIFIDRAHAKNFDSLYAKFTHRQLDFKELVYRCKKLIMKASMSSEVNVLGYQLDRISERDRRWRDFTLNSLTEALREVIACFPVYRTYVCASELLERDRRYIELAVARAKRRSPATSASIFDFLRDILLLNLVDHLDETARADRRRFVGRFQQVTSPVMAKAVEDTAFYIANRLVSLNEVGGDPQRFGTTPAAFHQQNMERQAHWPHSLLATSTHDTKRSEDVRARINVLSELPRDFRTRIFRWARWNQGKKTVLDDELVPNRNDEFLLYQTLIGTWPLDRLDPAGRETYVERIQDYMLKATREAKVDTSWVSPNEAYEKATREFVAAILAPSRRNPFLVDVETFAGRVAQLGMWNSLAQTLLKLTCPGIPDIYQGTELWDDSLVDPDNRRPVDYARRREMLQSIRQRARGDSANRLALAAELLANPRDGRIKLYVVWCMLGWRRENPGLFTNGRYIPLEILGTRRDHLFAFARKSTGSAAIVVVPRLIGNLNPETNGPPIGAEIWQDAELVLPRELCGAQYRNVLTGEMIGPDSSQGGAAVLDRVSVAEVLRSFPIAVLDCVGMA